MSPPGGSTVDVRAAACHHALLLGHLMLAQCHDPLQDLPRDGLIEYGLDTAEGDDESVLDSTAAPLGPARLVEVRRGLLDHATRQTGLPAHLGLGFGNPSELGGVGVTEVDQANEIQLSRLGVEYHNGTCQLVDDASLCGSSDTWQGQVPGCLADLFIDSCESHNDSFLVLKLP